MLTNSLSIEQAKQQVWEQACWINGKFYPRELVTVPWLEIASHYEPDEASSKLKKLLERTEHDSCTTHYYRVSGKERDAAMLILYSGDSELFRIRAEGVAFVQMVSDTLDAYGPSFRVSNEWHGIYMRSPRNLRDSMLALARTWGLDLDELLPYAA